MSLVAFSGSPQIISDGGPVFVKTFKAASNVNWNRGTLLKLSTNGTVTPCLATGSADTLDTDDTGTSGARLFVALTAWGNLVDTDNQMIDASGVNNGQTTSTAYPVDGYVPVQEVLRKTVFEGKVCTTSSGDAIADVAEINATYALYQLADGSWAVDIENTTKPVVQVSNVSPNYNPHATQSAQVYNKVYFNVLSAILQK